MIYEFLIEFSPQSIIIYSSLAAAGLEGGEGRAKGGGGGERRGRGNVPHPLTSPLPPLPPPSPVQRTGHTASIYIELIA